MIIKKSNIKHVDVEIFGEPLDKTIVEKQEDGFYKMNIPFKFKYNGSWKVKHNCNNCSNQCGFGLSFDSIKSPFPILTYFNSEYLCSKYYEISLLEDVESVFENVELLKYEMGSYVIFDKIFDNDFPVTSSIKLIFYSCTYCNNQYIGLLRNGYPYSADKGCPEGIIGTIYIDELINIELNNTESFQDLLKILKKK